MSSFEENLPTLISESLDSKVLELCDEAGIGCHILNGEGFYVQLNRVEREWLGFGAAELLGRKRMSDFLTPLGREEFQQLFAKLKRGEKVRRVELELISRAPSPLLLMVSAIPLRSAAESFLGGQFLLADISERIQLRHSDRRSLQMDLERLERIGVLEKMNQELRSLVEERRHDEERFRFREYYLYQSREELRELTAHLQQVIEADRSKISREIHDELGQSLTGLKMDLAWMIRKIGDSRDPADFDAVRERLVELSKSIDGTLGDVRRIARNLRPGTLDDLGLTAALEFHLQEFERRTGIACSFDCDGKIRELADSGRIEIFRIFQEIMTNVARHAEASEVRVQLREEFGGLLLDVADNGCGISLQGGEAKSLGLIGMRERTALLGGVLEISGTPKSGTRIRLHIPRDDSLLQSQGGLL